MCASNGVCVVAGLIGSQSLEKMPDQINFRFRFLGLGVVGVVTKQYTVNKTTKWQAFTL